MSKGKNHNTDRSPSKQSQRYLCVKTENTFLPIQYNTISFDKKKVSY